MDNWKFYDITHADHVYANPLSPSRLEEIMSLLALPNRAQVLDIGCGRAELLIRLGERYGVVGVGIDKSPYAIKRAREESGRRPSDGQLVFFHQDGGEYFAPPNSFDLAVCLGASWIFHGHRTTIGALARFVRVGGHVMVGQPFWIKPPPDEYLAALDAQHDTYDTHAANVFAGEAEGLAPVYATATAPEDWDRYEALQWLAAERYVAANPDDPDNAALLARVSANRTAYLKWGRDTLGWGIYVFRR